MTLPLGRLCLRPLSWGWALAAATATASTAHGMTNGGGALYLSARGLSGNHMRDRDGYPGRDMNRGTGKNRDGERKRDKQKRENLVMDKNFDMESRRSDPLDSELVWRSQALADAPNSYRTLRDAFPPSAEDGLDILFKEEGIIWMGDYHHGWAYYTFIQQLFDKKYMKKSQDGKLTLKELFLEDREKQARRSTVLSRFVIKVYPGHNMQHMPRAPDMRDALVAAFGDIGEPYLTPFREMKGVSGSWNWSKVGVHIPLLDEHIYPHYGVFCPTVRNDYIKLMSTVSINSKAKLAYDIGVGSGVLSAMLLKRGLERVVGTDISLRALNCASDNLTRLGLKSNVDLIKCNIYPDNTDSIGSIDGGIADVTKPSLPQEKPDLIVCNPPWLPCMPSPNLMDVAIYDNNSDVLRQYLNGIQTHLGEEEHCEAFLILSDLAEHFGLRSRAELEAMFEAANLVVVDKIDTVACDSPKSKKASIDKLGVLDRIQEARGKEVTSLWRLKVRRNKAE
jgi:SAM-dependent methyltransferase